MSSFAKKFLAICIGAAVVGYIAYSVLLPTYHIRYRLSLDVEVDGKVETSSSVIEISYQILPDSLVFAGGPGGAFGGKMRGAAPTIDLGQHGLVFIINSQPEICAAINSCDASRQKGVRLTTLPLVAFGFPASGLPSSMAIYLRRLKSKLNTVDVPIETLPMFVRFGDIDNPRTFEEVNPLTLQEKLGHNVRIIRATIKLTDDPVTPQPNIWPKWLREGDGPIFRPKLGELAIDPSVNYSDFYRK